MFVKRPRASVVVSFDFLGGGAVSHHQGLMISNDTTTRASHVQRAARGGYSGCAPTDEMGLRSRPGRESYRSRHIEVLDVVVNRDWHISCFARSNVISLDRGECRILAAGKLFRVRRRAADRKKLAGRS
jgi:hypothetical protein